MKWKRKGMRKLWVNIPDIMYDRLKNHAQKRNVSFTKIVNRALLKYILEEDKYE